MKISGFTFIRNAVKFDYPIVEAISSILPICDEVIVALGNSEDSTLELIQSIGSDKIKIIHTEWDDSLREGGKVLALETDKAFKAISKDADWCFYIQGDEVIHEQYLDTVKDAMFKYLNDKKVEGLLFNYLHFWGSYEYIGNAPSWYRKEIRVIRNNPAIHSYKDAQGFRINHSKLKVKQIDAWIYHYGWVKNPHYQKEKVKSFSKYWHSEEQMDQNREIFEMFDYSTVDTLGEFKGTHPKVMLKRISQQNWIFKFDMNKKKLSLKNRLKILVEKTTGWRMGEYKNYIKIS